MYFVCGFRMLESFDAHSFCETSIYQKYTAYSEGHYFNSNHNVAESFHSGYRGLDCMSWFVNNLENIAKLVALKLKNAEPMNTIVSLEDMTDTCHIWGKVYWKW